MYNLGTGGRACVRLAWPGADARKAVLLAIVAGLAALPPARVSCALSRIVERGRERGCSAASEASATVRESESKSHYLGVPQRNLVITVRSSRQ